MWFLLLQSLLLTLFAILVVNSLIKKLNLLRQNFRGDKIPTGYGLILILSSAPLYALMCVTAPSGELRALMFLITVVMFGAVGFIDDLFGTREVGGFKGHFGLLLHGKLTTGAIKAIIGGLVALALGVVIAKKELSVAILNALLIVFSANSLNLLDLRPGRAVSFFWIGLLALAILKLFHLSIWHELVILMPAAIWLTLLDRSAKIMLGDAGSNTLGAILGLAFALEIGVVGKLIIVIFLGALQVYAEKYSITKLIEGNRIMREIDRRMGVR
ncbi:MAG: hypothetical protein QME62_13385 [Armatimonadota bacterium]|nr:hypothetical protein [Armatimonadota bacterium]